MPYRETIDDPIPAQTLTSSGVGAAVDLRLLRTAALVVDLTSLSGTCVLKLETAHASSGPWRVLADFPALSVGPSREVLFPGCSRFVRMRWTLSGTSPSAVLSCTGQSVQTYATPAKLRGQRSGERLSKFSDEALEAFLQDATDLANGYFPSRYALPLTSWGGDLERAVCAIAFFDALSQGGFNPESSADAVFVTRHDTAVRWLEQISQGRVTPAWLVDATPETVEGGSSMTSKPRRGWGNRGGQDDTVDS